MNKQNLKILFNSHSYKIIAIITMIIDHVGYFLFPNLLLFRIIGRMSFPLFAFLIVYGFSKTKNNLNYLLKLVLMFLIIQIPLTWYLSHNSIENPFYMNIFFILSISSITICLWKNQKIFAIMLWTLILTFLIYVQMNDLTITTKNNNTINIFKIDYGIYGFLLITLMYLFIDLFRTHLNINSLLIEKIIIITVFIILVILDRYWFDNSDQFGNIKLYSLICTPLFLLFVDQNIRLNKYLKNLIYLVYPLNIAIIVLIKFFL